ncbi:unnamed protein product, partial [Symbiodinium sp. KB8]
RRGVAATHVVQDELGYDLVGSLAGVFATPAVRGHAVDAAHAFLSELLLATLDALENMDDAEVTALRAAVIKEWMHLAVSLAKEEDALKASMHPDVSSITKSKRILLWEALLKKYSYPDQK